MSERYRVIGRVGSGGMSAVYRACDTVMGREVALKRLLPIEETRLNEGAEESLAREAAALARFQHPNIVTVYAFESDAEGPFVVMELVEGGDLRSLMESGPLSWEEFREIALQCLDPLVAAGELNLLHRDIKPGNLMITQTASGRRLVKLLDFGLAKFSSRPSLQTLDQQGSFLGSIDYIAPEQLELRPLDQRTDLYSLGCVFYYMLARKAPFSGGSPAETTMNHLQHRCRPIAELRPDLPPLVGAWLMRMISRDPEDRPESAKEALRQFFDAEKGVAWEDPMMLGDIPDDPFADLPDMEGVAEPEDFSVAVAMTAHGDAGRGRREAPGARTASGRRLIVPAAARWASRSRLPLPPRGRDRLRAWWRRVRTLAGKPPLWIAAAVLAGATALTVHLATRGGDPVSNAPPTEEAGEGWMPQRNPGPLPYPGEIELEDGRPDPPPLPLEDGLFARFHGEKGVFGRDYRRPPVAGERVAAWANLAFPVWERSLLREPDDAAGEGLPGYGGFDSSQIPGLKGSHRAVVLSNRSALTMARHPGVLPRGFTLVAMAKLEDCDDHLFRVTPPEPDGHRIHLSTTATGRVAAVYREAEEGPETRISISWEPGTAGLLVYRWEPAREQRLASYSSKGTKGAEATGAVGLGGAAFGMIAVGMRGDGETVEVPTGNLLFEFAVFERILSEKEAESLAKELSKRYFGP